ncbi:hypothetical protein F7725_021122 [Dissostichus mawsoni]|uniref:Calsyntenin C-terminal domain-containing protein n=1 Tax=Dissostichus mawsoni TaxID=36200 RepID=A0A7J5YF61_DISMA|nr:hypothetical protein F7725_021122 [Dissostichus mawsoni]
MLDPPLVALDKDAPVPYADLCFNIQGLEAPFEAVVLNGTSGEGQLRARGLVDCELQKEAVVHIQVNDVNEFAPVFREPEYRAAVTEGKIYDSILQVEATDQDCSPQNTEKLSFDRQQQFEIQVTAWDCGQKRALHSVPVHINVKPVCKPGWQGGTNHIHAAVLTEQQPETQMQLFVHDCLHWSKRVDYEPGTGSKQLFPKMHLETCGGPLSSVRTTVELQNNHIGKGCDRETYSEKSLQKLCGASSGSTDLLPAPSASTNWTASLVTDSGRDSDLIFRFDGHQAAKIPDWVVPQNLTDQFTIATWMKHGPTPGLRAEKETLLCNSDKTGGEVTKPWFTQYFRGSLSGLTIRPGKIESQKVISCLQACKEGLDINSLESLDKNIKFHFNPAQSILVMEGEDLENMNTAVRKVAYINSHTCISILDIDAVVMVLQPSEPRITITGLERLNLPTSDLQEPEGQVIRQVRYYNLRPAVPSAATLVIVMCIAALVVVVVFGIYRIHLTHQQEGRLGETAREARGAGTTRLSPSPSTPWRSKRGN